MRALIDWSYDLLSVEERTLFRTVSIFADGFSLETVTAVAANETMDEIGVLDALSSLVDKSLVQTELVGSGTRYRLLESTRQYAREKLTDCGALTAVARAHAAAHWALAEDLERGYETTPERDWLARIQPELENWRAALEWALAARGDVVTGQHLAGGLRLWSNLAAAEARRWVRAALDAVELGTPAEVVAKLELAEAQLAGVFSLFKVSHAAAERALTLYGTGVDQVRTTWAQRYAGRALVMLGRISEGEALLEKALSAARTLGARKLTAWVLQDISSARYVVGDIAQARTLSREALEIAKLAGSESAVGAIAANLAEAEFRGGDARMALQLAAEALQANRSRSATTVATSVCNMAAYAIALQHYNEARTHAREALSLYRDLQSEVGVACTLQHLAAIEAFRTDDRSGAARLLGYVNARFTALDVQREFTEQQEYDKMLVVLRDAFGEGRLAKLMVEGGAWSEDRAVAQGLLV